jgi:hypothetical protein
MADTQTVVPAPVEPFGGKRIVGQGGDTSADGPHAVLVVHEAVR